jgi:hypothetical protein
MEWGDGYLGSDITAIEGRFDCPVHGCNDADKLGELAVHFSYRDLTANI